MRITYYEETDSAFIVLKEPEPERANEVAGETLEEPETGKSTGVVLHRDEAGELYYIEIYSRASARLDLSRLDIEGLASYAREAHYT